MKERKQHKEYRRVVEGANTAILFVHGIIGTPNHFEKYLPLVPDNISIYNIVIDGHCAGVLDFGRSSLERWEKSYKKVVEELSEKYEKIYVVAHSMGTLFTINEAIVNPKIAGTFFLNVPIIIYLHPIMVPSAFRIVYDIIPENNTRLVDMVDCYGINKDKNILKYLTWVPRFVELASLVRRTRKILGNFKTPATAYQGSLDEVVLPASIKYLKKHSSMNVVTLKNSGHYHYGGGDMEFLLEEFEKFIVTVVSRE